MINLFISCIDSHSSHPSSRLFRKYHNTHYCIQSFQDSRSISDIIQSSFFLHNFYRNNKVNSVTVNLNGSFVVFLALLISFFHGVKRRYYWQMDLYPGCLRYVTRFWFVYWPFFYVCEFLSRLLATKIFSIDESFKYHYFKFINSKYIFSPLKFKSYFVSKSNNVIENTIGLIGNIEKNWFDLNINNILCELESMDFNLIIATSNMDLKLSLSNLNSPVVRNIYMPWENEDTHIVLSSFNYMLIGLSSSRVIYSSPSKIIDCYSRGIIPIIHCDYNLFIENKYRNIYKYCIHYDDFLNGKRVSKNCLIEHFNEVYCDK